MLDYKQIQSINSRPFLTLSNLISMFHMIALQHLVCVVDDLDFFHIHQICGYYYCILEEHPEYVDEFITLYSENLTFLDS